MAVQFTFRRKDLMMLLEKFPDARNMIVTYDEKSGTPYVAYPELGQAKAEGSDGDEIIGCPYPPGCN